MATEVHRRKEALRAHGGRGQAVGGGLAAGGVPEDRGAARPGPAQRAGAVRRWHGEGTPMMVRNGDGAGDYGYDLAHEEITRRTAAEDPPADLHVGAVPSGGREEVTDDLSYDEAHGF